MQAERPATAGRTEPAARRDGSGLLPLLLIAVAAAAPRLLGTFDDLWLDEIWSLRLAALAGGPLDVFTDLHHDNNHYLNTLWILLLGGDAPGPLLRLPALAAGVVAVWLAGRAAGGRREGALAAVLLAVSYPFVHYASEARGYGLVVPASLAAWWLLARHLDDGRTRSALAFAGLACLGLLAHLTFVTVYAPLLLWSTARLLRPVRPESPARLPRPARVASAWDRLALLHGPPLALLSLLYAVDLRWLRLGGGPELTVWRGWLEAWAYTVGTPIAPAALSLPLLAAFAVPILAELEGLRRRRDDAWIFFLLVLATPVALLLALGARYAPPRYFLASLPFGVLLLARGLARLQRAPAPWPLAAAGLIALFVGGNGWRVGRFLAEGRGAYREAVLYLAAAGGGDTIRVASDHDFRNRLLLERYARDLPAGRALEYVPRDRAEAEPPEWRLAHGFEEDWRPPAALDAPGPARYELRAVFRKYGLSGWHWAVYRRRDAGGEGPASDPARDAAPPAGSTSAPASGSVPPRPTSPSLSTRRRTRR